MEKVKKKSFKVYKIKVRIETIQKQLNSKLQGKGDNVVSLVAAKSAMYIILYANSVQQNNL